EIVVGHGVGQLVAGHIAGVLTLGDAATLVVRRARLVNKPHTLDDEATFAAAIRSIDRRVPEFTMASRGSVLKSEQALDAAFWTKSLLLQSDNTDMLAGLTLPMPTAALVIGPGGRTSGTNGATMVLSTLAGEGRDVESVFEALAQLWVRGVEVDWSAIH